jgi:hypothetical protein
MMGSGKDEDVGSEEPGPSVWEGAWSPTGLGAIGADS